MSTAKVNDLDDDQFAYIEPGGKKDEHGRTTPRSLRHFPISDAAHVRNALNIGLTREEIAEILMQIAGYAGFPASLNALATAKAVFEQDKR